MIAIVGTIKVIFIIDSEEMYYETKYNMKKLSFATKKQ